MKYFNENNKIEILDEYDIIVVGMGIAGISAAIAAARLNQRVLIIEKSVIPGGLATLGLIAIYLPLCDGCGRKVIGGISEELLLDSIKYGYDTAISVLYLKTSSTRHFSAPLSMQQIRSFFMILLRNIRFDIIG